MTIPVCHYNDPDKLKAFCNDLVQWGKPGHEELEIVQVSENGTTYRTIKTCPTSSSSTPSLEEKAGLIHDLIKENLEALEKIPGDLPRKLINRVMTHLEDKDKGQYFEDIYNEYNAKQESKTSVEENKQISEVFQEINLKREEAREKRYVAENKLIEANKILEGAKREAEAIIAKAEAVRTEVMNSKKLEEARLTGQVALERPLRQKTLGDVLTEDKDHLSIRFICKDGEEVFARDTAVFTDWDVEDKNSFFVQAAKEWKELTAKVGSIDKVLEISLKDFSAKAVQHFVKAHYEVKEPMPFDLLVENEKLARELGDLSLLKSCQDAINHWKQQPDYLLLLIDLLSKSLVSSDSKIYENIPFNKLKDVKSILSENAAIIKEIAKKAPVLPENALGKEASEKFLGIKIDGVEPAIPAKLRALDPKEFDLILFPKSINGKAVGGAMLEEIAQKVPDETKRIKKFYCPDLFETHVVEGESEWVAVTKDFVKDSIRKTGQDQDKLLKDQSLIMSRPLVMTYIAILRHAAGLKSQTFLEKGLYTRAKEGEVYWVVGGLSSVGLFIFGFSDYADDNGVVGQRK